MVHVPTRLAWKAVAVAGAMSLGLAACSSSGSGGSGGSGGGSDSGGALTIGASLPLTGDFSEPGTAAKQGYEVWQAVTNANGGLLGKQVKLTIKDDASNQNTIVSDYNALVSQDNVDLLLGTFSSLLNLPASSVAEKNRMLYVEPAGGSPDMFNRGYKYLFFAQQATADKQGLTFADWVKNLPAGQRPKTAAYPTLDDPFAAPNVDGIRQVLEGAGIKTVYKTTYAIDTKNFDSIVAAMKSANPDLVVHGATFEDGVGVTRAMLKSGWTPKMFYETSTPSFADQYVKAIGAGNTEGVMYAVSYSPEADTPGNTDFVAQYKKMFHSDVPPEDAADAYAAAQVMQAAVEAVGSIDDQAKLADWLRSHPVDTILGSLSWDETGAPQGDFLIGQWIKGTAEVVLPADVATAKPEVGWHPSS
jgi:branched-chain amino acid transport system substrate-binding protein